MVREKMDVLFGFLARLQVAHRDHMVRSSREYDRAQQQFDRRHRAVAVAQAGLDHLVRSGQQPGPRRSVRETFFQAGADQA